MYLLGVGACAASTRDIPSVCLIGWHRGKRLLPTSIATGAVGWRCTRCVGQAMRAHTHKYKCLTYDIIDSLEQDVLSDAGFLNLLKHASRIRRTGISVLAPICSSFCWLYRYTSGRSLIEPLGNENRESVFNGNLMLSRIILILMLLMARGAVFILEQPMGSILPEHPRFAEFLRRHIIFRVPFCSPDGNPGIAVLSFCCFW